MSLLPVIAALVAQLPTPLRTGEPNHSPTAAGSPTVHVRELEVVATVISMRSFWSSNGRRLLTEVELEEARVVGGPRRLTVLRRGGQVGDLVQVVGEEPTFEVGEQVAVVLRPLGLSGRYRVLEKVARTGGVR